MAIGILDGDGRDRRDRGLIQQLQGTERQKNAALKALRLDLLRSQKNLADLRSKLTHMTIPELSARGDAIVSAVKAAQAILEQLAALDPSDPAIVVLTRTISVLSKEYNFIGRRLRGSLQDYNTVNRNITELSNRINRLGVSTGPRGNTGSPSLNTTGPAIVGGVGAIPDVLSGRDNNTGFTATNNTQVKMNRMGNYALQGARPTSANQPSPRVQPSQAAAAQQRRLQDVQQQFWTAFRQDSNRNSDQTIKALKLIADKLDKIKGGGGGGGSDWPDFDKDDKGNNRRGRSSRLKTGMAVRGAMAALNGAEFLDENGRPLKAGSSNPLDAPGEIRDWLRKDSIEKSFQSIRNHIRTAIGLDDNKSNTPQTPATPATPNKNMFTPIPSMAIRTDRTPAPPPAATPNTKPDTKPFIPLATIGGESTDIAVGGNSDVSVKESQVVLDRDTTKNFLERFFGYMSGIAVAGPGGTPGNTGFSTGGIGSSGGGGGSGVSALNPSIGRAVTRGRGSDYIPGVTPGLGQSTAQAQADAQFSRQQAQMPSYNPGMSANAGAGQSMQLPGDLGGNAPKGIGDLPVNIGGSGPQYRAKYNLGQADLSDAVVRTVAGEANMRDPKSVDAVINAMMNRVGTKGYGPSGDLAQVAGAPGQFAAYNKGNPTAAQAQMIRDRITAIASGSEPDITGGAQEFRAASYSGPWAQNHVNDSQVIGGNRFARNTSASALGSNSSYANPQPGTPGVNVAGLPGLSNPQIASLDDITKNSVTSNQPGMFASVSPPGTIAPGGSTNPKMSAADTQAFWSGDRNPEGSKLYDKSGNPLVNPQLLSAAAAGAQSFEAQNPGYSIRAFGPASGLRTSGSTANHGAQENGLGAAVDFAIVDKNTGKILTNHPNYTNQQGSVGDTAPLYQSFFNETVKAGSGMYPGFEKDARFGGYFAGGSNPLDLMHIDMRGRKVPMGGGSIAGGFTPEQMRRFGIQQNNPYNPNTPLAGIKPPDTTAQNKPIMPERLDTSKGTDSDDKTGDGGSGSTPVTANQPSLGATQTPVQRAAGTNFQTSTEGIKNQPLGSRGYSAVNPTGQGAFTLPDGTTINSNIAIPNPTYTSGKSPTAASASGDAERNLDGTYGPNHSATPDGAGTYDRSNEAFLRESENVDTFNQKRDKAYNDYLQQGLPKPGEKFGDWLNRRQEMGLDGPQGRGEGEAQKGYDLQGKNDKLSGLYDQYQNPDTALGKLADKLDSGDYLTDNYGLRGYNKNQDNPEYTPKTPLTMDQIRGFAKPDSTQQSITVTPKSDPTDTTGSVTVKPKADDTGADRIPYTPPASSTGNFKNDNDGGDDNKSKPDTSVPGSGSAGQDNTKSTNSDSASNVSTSSIPMSHSDLGLVAINNQYLTA